MQTLHGSLWDMELGERDEEHIKLGKGAFL
jgi:hypothetical protein